MSSESTVEQNKAIYRRFLEEAFNNGRLETVDELLSPSYVLHDLPPGTPSGPDAVKRVITSFRAAFPDLKITIEELMAEGDKVCARAISQGTHEGPIFGIPATGKPVSITGLTMVRILDSHITDSWVKNDVVGLLNQIGVTSLPR